VDIRSVHQLVFTANIVPSSPILVTLTIKAILSSETWVLTRATRRHFPEIVIVHVRFEVFTAATMKNAVDVTPCGYFKNRRFGGTILAATSKNHTVSHPRRRHSS
jgi:hypothetical protein